jgi:RNA polymerase sigma factor for flagellar operon FliA
MPAIQAKDNQEKAYLGSPGPRDEVDRGALVAKYTPLVRFLANRIGMRLPPNISIDDLISAGSLGLLDAVEKYDPRKEAQLKTYAEFRIKGAILDELRNMDWLPRSIRKKIREIEQATGAVEQRLNRPARDSEIAGEMGIDLDTYYDILDKAQDIELLSLDECIDSYRDNAVSKRSYKNLIRADDDPVDHIMTKELKKVIADGVKALPNREQMVVSLYYYDGLTLKEIGEIMGLTESRVSQIHGKIIMKLRTKFTSYFKT